MDNLHAENSDDSGKSDTTFFKRDQRIEVLSDSIRTEFSNELQMIFNQLASARADTGLLPALGDSIRRGSILKDKMLVKYFADYRFFNEILWICKEGDQQAMLATHTIDLKDPDLNLNLRERKYFSWVLNDSTWKLPSDPPMSEREISFLSQWQPRGGHWNTVEGWCSRHCYSANVSNGSSDAPRLSVLHLRP
jgi:hypothetical protein